MNPGIVHSLFLDAVPSPFKLAWQTQQSWMNGDYVKLYSTTQPLNGFCIYGKFSKVLLDGQCINPLWLNKIRDSNITTYGRRWDYSLLPSDLFKRSRLSFLLAQENEMDSNTQINVVPVSSSILANGFQTPLSRFDWTLVKNEQPILTSVPTLNDAAPLESLASTGLHILSCSEAENIYEFKIGIQQIAINNIKGSVMLLVCFLT
jgi:hypothetical protein